MRYMLHLGWDIAQLKVSHSSRSTTACAPPPPPSKFPARENKNNPHLAVELTHVRTHKHTRYTCGNWASCAEATGGPQRPWYMSLWRSMSGACRSIYSDLRSDRRGGDGGGGNKGGEDSDVSRQTSRVSKGGRGREKLSEMKCRGRLSCQGRLAG